MEWLKTVFGSTPRDEGVGRGVLDKSPSPGSRFFARTFCRKINCAAECERCFVLYKNLNKIEGNRRQIARKVIFNRRGSIKFFNLGDSTETKCLPGYIYSRQYHSVVVKCSNVQISPRAHGI